jgi:hypothetical protein
MKEQSPTIQAKNPDRRQLLITLSVPENEIIRVETFDEIGTRVGLPDREFAALVGDHDVGDLLSVLEQVYVAEFFDVNGDLELDDIEIEFDDELEPVVVRRVTSHRLIRFELRKLILSRLLRRVSLASRHLTQGSVHWEEFFARSRKLFH